MGEDDAGVKTMRSACANLRSIIARATRGTGTRSPGWNTPVMAGTRVALLAAPRTLAVRHSPDADLHEGWARVRVKLAGICGSDLKMWRYGSRRLSLPAVIGHEVVGIVETAPAGFAHLTGCRVVMMPDVPCDKCPQCLQGNYNLCDVGRSIGWELAGGFAEYVAIPPESLSAGGLVPVPKGMSDEEASWPNLSPARGAGRKCCVSTHPIRS